MPDEGPLIFRMQMSADTGVEAFSPRFDCVWFALAGTVEVDGADSMAAGEFFCASAETSYRLKAGHDGAQWLVFCSSSLQPL